MYVVDPSRHPLLYQFARPPFPSSEAWANEIERWLSVVHRAGELGRYRSRLHAIEKQRNEALAELVTAHFFAERCGLPIVEWEPPGLSGRTGEFVLEVDQKRIFVEVKSPGWEAEIVEVQGKHSPRLRQPKLIHGEARWTDNEPAIRYAVKKAYTQLPAAQPTLLVVVPDTWKSPFDWHLEEVRQALFAPADPESEGGCFTGPAYERLGGVAILEPVMLEGADHIDYYFALFRNPIALPSSNLPQAFTDRLPQI